MPAIIPQHVILRTRLKDTIRDTMVLNDRLEQLITERSREPSGRFHGKIDHSSPPWNPAVANAILDLHAMSRDMEAWLRLSQGLRTRQRGGSGENTRKALQAVQRLAEAAQDATVRAHTRDLDRWIRQALAALNILEPPRRLPQIPGKPEPACPGCENHTLRMIPLKGKIFCCNPACPGIAGHKAQAHMRFSPLGEWMIVWSDGIAGIPA
jgi:hypothetical protein